MLRLKHQKKSIHEGVRYQCDKCDYAAKQYSNLKKHNESMHKGVRYQCDYCEYAATTISNLKKHQKRRHSSDSSVATKVMNVRVMIRKLNISKYQISQDKPYIVEPMSVETSDISDEESDIEQKENIDDQLSLIKIELSEIDLEMPDISANIKHEADLCDIESKIDVEQDLVLKTESSDLSEFLN